MTTLTGTRAQEHLASGQKFLAAERWEDAVAEFTMAINASLPNPLPSALTGKARAMDEITQSLKEMLPVWEAARPYLSQDRHCWFDYILYGLAHYDEYSHRLSSSKDSKILKGLAKHASESESLISAEISAMNAAVTNNNYLLAHSSAVYLKLIADWADAYTAEPFDRTPYRSLAIKIFQAIRDSKLESVIPEDATEIREEVRDELIGHANRRLTFRNANATAAKYKGVDSGSNRSFPIWGWAGAALVEVILLVAVTWLGVLIVLGVAGFFIYRKTR